MHVWPRRSLASTALSHGESECRVMIPINMSLESREDCGVPVSISARAGERPRRIADNFAFSYKLLLFTSQLSCHDVPYPKPEAWQCCVSTGPSFQQLVQMGGKQLLVRLANE